jgi:serine/threonine protein phosphatase 1
MEAIAPTSDDGIYFLGDLIDRGTQSAQVLDFVQSHGYVSLLGNHEQMLLEAFPGGQVSTQALQTWLYSGGQATVSSYEQPEQLLEKLDWIRTFPTHLDLGEFWLVHAGLHPGLKLEDQTRHEFCWIREAFHSSTEPYFQDKLIITGHTITFTLPDVSPGQIARGKGWLGIDTGAYHPKSGWLTALDITNHYVYQVHVFSELSRTLTLDDVVIDIDPSNVRNRRQFNFLEKLSL